MSGSAASPIYKLRTDATIPPGVHYEPAPHHGPVLNVKLIERDPGDEPPGNGR